MPVVKKSPFHAAGFVLAGGLSSRMGRDKALLKLDGVTLVERSLAKLRIVCDEVAIAGGAAELHQFARVVPDTTAGSGPLGGIVAALEQSSHEWNLFLPVDAPFVPVACLRALLEAAVEGTADAVVAQSHERLQPLCCALSRKMLPGLRRELEAGRWKVAPAQQSAGVVRVMEFAEVQWFANLNSPAEYAQAIGGKMEQ